MFRNDIKILVVDDMLTMRKVVSKILRDLGYSDITQAVDGNDAWEKAKNGSFGLIISDWNMPKCTGVEFLKKIREDATTAKTPFLLVTAEAEQHQIVEAIKSGVDQYVVKPFTTDGLKAKLMSVYVKYSSVK
jgi:two-component system, chemotaxis family, chemotaxis protein CheY